MKINWHIEIEADINDLVSPDTLTAKLDHSLEIWRIRIGMFDGVDKKKVKYSIEETRKK